MKHSETGLTIEEIQDFLAFLQVTRERLASEKVPETSEDVQRIRSAVDEYREDDRGNLTKYQRFESVFYDDAPQLLTLWQIFADFDTEQLRRFQGMVQLELKGLTGDRHPRKVFDRSPFGLAALTIGTITVWMTFVRNYSGEDLSELLELIRFNAVVGLTWIVGLFVVLWYILRVFRNNRQVAFLASLSRALDVYLRDP